MPSCSSMVALYGLIQAARPLTGPRRVRTDSVSYRILYEETIAWLRSMEHPHGSRAPKHAWFAAASLTPVGWASEYLAHGTEAWTTGYESHRYDQPSTWPKELKDVDIAQGGHPSYGTDKVVLSGAEKMLAILKSEGLAGGTCSKAMPIGRPHNFCKSALRPHAAASIQALCPNR